jgi:hypothetical protein
MRLQLHNPDAPVSRLCLGWLRLIARAVREKALWIALLVGALAITLAYQRSVTIDIGSTADDIFTAGFHETETSGQARFRWSTGESALRLRGVGKPLAPFNVSLQMSAGPRPGPVQVDVRANGHPASSIALGPESKLYTLQVDPSWVDLSGDLRFDFSTTTYRPENDRRDLGFILDFARVDTPAGLTLPSLTQSGMLLLCASLLYLIARMVWLRSLPAGIVASLFLLASAGGIALQRMAVTLFTTRLAFALVLAILLALLVESFIRALAHSLGWNRERALPEWMWAGLRALVLVTVVLKVGGLLHPYTFIIDSEFHIKYITYMSEARPWEQYFGDSLAFAVMPKEEWGAARAFIPYSPFFYVVSAPLALLPLPLTLSVAIAGGIFESLKMVLVFLIGLALGRDGTNPQTAARWALAAGAVYAFIPATFLLQQWGNWPTQASLWLLTLWAALTTLFWSRITSPLPWVVTTSALALTMLAYTVSAVYTGLFVGLLAVVGWLLAPLDRRRWGAIMLSLVAATALALLIYYGQFVGRMLAETLPTFGGAIEDQGKLTTLRPSLWDFVTDHLATAMQSYRLAMIYALGLAGALLILFASGQGTARPARPELVYALTATTSATNTAREAVRRVRVGVPWRSIWLGVWLLMFPIFTLADFYVDQALKQFWYALPAIAVVAGGWLLALLSRRTRIHTLLVWLIGATLVWQSLNLWVFRLFFHNR